MTAEEVKSLNLGITPVDDRTILIVESGIDWLKTNTTLDLDDLAALPPCVRLFLVKFNDIYSVSAGVSSESIEGLSQSYSQRDNESLIWDIASSLLGGYLKSRVRFVAAEKRWN